MIVGTAGHIDHGKTALVKALTGVDADRLKDEKARGITIDLGFAYMPVGDGEVLGFVDVPGHDRFVRNMLAGATGIDFVLLVVAANDGVMPQTREHFDIMNLLGLSRGAVALTKCDLVSEERRTEVVAQIETLTKDTPLAAAKVFPLSTVTGDGIEALHDELVGAMRAFTPQGGDELFRLAVDRNFSLRGAGTVVTGAVLSGRVSVDDIVMLSPSGLEARVRSIHAQNQPVQSGHVGQRCALNLVGEGISAHVINRGDVVLDKAAHAPAIRIDASLNFLASETRPLAHWTPVRLHHAASETSARIALLQEEPIKPGQQGRIQLVLDKPIAAAMGDRFIIRDTSGERTIGGGHFLDLRGPHRRRKVPARLAQLDALSYDTQAEVLTELLAVPPYIVDIAGFARDRVLGKAQLETLLANVPHVKAKHGNDDLLVSPAIWKLFTDSALAALEDYHRTYPQLLGPGVARLARQLQPQLRIKTGSVIIRTLIATGILASEGGAVRLPGHRLALDQKDYRLWKRIIPYLSGEDRFRPPHGRECAKLMDERELDVRRVLKAMAKQKSVHELAADRFFLRETINEMAGIAAEVAQAQENGLFTAAQFRDRLGNGRKVAIEILEYFDRYGLTSRRGDLRIIVLHRLADYVDAVSTATSSAVNEEENRSRWNVRTSNPGGAVSQP